MNAMFVCLHGPWGKHHGLIIYAQREHSYSQYLSDGINYQTALIVHLITHLHTLASSMIVQAFEGYFDS
jgi:hypothetical protein